MSSKISWCLVERVRGLISKQDDIFYFLVGLCCLIVSPRYDEWIEVQVVNVCSSLNWPSHTWLTRRCWWGAREAMIELLHPERTCWIVLLIVLVCNWLVQHVASCVRQWCKGGTVPQQCTAGFVELWPSTLWGLFQSHSQYQYCAVYHTQTHTTGGLFCSFAPFIKDSWSFTWRLRKRSWWTPHVHRCPPSLEQYMGQTDQWHMVRVVHTVTGCVSITLNESDISKIPTKCNCDVQVFPIHLCEDHKP